MRILGTGGTRPVRRTDPQHASVAVAGVPGAHAVRDALAHGAAVTGATVHLVDETLDGGPIVAQEAVPILPGDDAEALHARIRAVEHRLLPRAVAMLLAEAVAVDGRQVTIDLERADAVVPRPRRALLSVSDKTGLVDLGRGLVARGFELVSTGGTARTLREAGLPVTDVAAVTGSPEMLDGRVKTLHPRIHGGLLADRRLEEHRRQLLGAGIAPFELVVVNLYPFAAALERPGITIDELIEEIDIGGPSMVRAAAKNHANVAIVTSPARYPAILAALDGPAGLDDGLRRELAVEAFAHTAAYDARIAAELPGRLDPGRPARGPRRSLPADAHDRAREGRDACATARTRISRRPATGARGVPRRTARSRPASRHSRARDSRTTTCSMRRRPPASVARCEGRPASSSSTPTRAAPRNGRPPRGVGVGTGWGSGVGLRRRRRADAAR